MSASAIKRQTKLRRVLLAFALAALPLFETLAGGLTLTLGDSQISQEVFSLFAAPGESLSLGFDYYTTGRPHIRFEGQEVKPPDDGTWRFNAPQKPGLYSVELRYPAAGETTQLNLFVGTVLPPGGVSLEGYRIGSPPAGHSNYPALYRSPRLYIRVTRDMLTLPVSDHFSLGQFVCKQASGFPKYLALSEELLVLLEGLVTAVQLAGYPAETFGIISGYRTPYYNQLIGNVAASRHVYGDALDFYVDINGDGVMDDLDGDGDTTYRDVDLLYSIVENYREQAKYKGPRGGIGRYYRTDRHSGFVHVDTRGYKARW